MFTNQFIQFLKELFFKTFYFICKIRARRSGNNDFNITAAVVFVSANMTSFSSRTILSNIRAATASGEAPFDVVSSITPCFDPFGVFALSDREVFTYPGEIMLTETPLLATSARKQSK
mmetsp:Transcript_11411/g.15703  ORF Transcript_11411/g.15703 Transcript_11411/m.15703 type:complete len:118 (+) Transcript_11411:764-1117(+)